MSEHRLAKVGELRPSQMLFTFGVGSIIDLPNLSAIVMGLDDWNTNPTYMSEIDEERLLVAVRKHLGHQVARLCSPPQSFEENNGYGKANDSSNIGVPVAPFPRWLRCPKCGLLSNVESGLFSLKVDRYRPDRTGYVHVGCSKSSGDPNVLPVRFLVGCKNGHIDDFPWVQFVHKGSVCARPQLHLYEMGAAGEASGIIVKCETCKNIRNMSEAFGPNAFQVKCSGRRPHLRDRQSAECDEDAKTMLLGASNMWFPVTLSALSIPSATGKLAQLVIDNWSRLREAPALETLSYLRSQGLLPGFDEFTADEIWAAVAAKKDNKQDGEPQGKIDLKRPEWELLSKPATAPETEDFKLTSVLVPDGFGSLLADVVLAERLREVRSLVGFTRIESPPDSSDVIDPGEVKRAPISRKPPLWVPAIEVRGEGIFIRFSESAIADWCKMPDVLQWEKEFLAAHCEWRRVRKIDPEDAGFPGIRYVLLHSFAHALMRQLVLECGYSAASIRERIYSSNPDLSDEPMAGVLIYTAAPDSEGTLGGLVSQGDPGELRRHILQALEQIELCASDPLCAEHRPSSDGMTLHGAACHACLFAPETSCERGNRYLDRAVLRSTFGSAVSAYFEGIF